MPVLILPGQSDFPPTTQADDNGLLAIGGQLTVESLLNAYRRGIFPWYNEGEPVCWYTPDPRFVLFPSRLHISRTMKKILGKNQFSFTKNTAFAEVVENCRTVKRKGEYGTWISDEIETAYNNLYEKGYAESAEAWDDGQLAGGLYGIRIGQIFFGESMFAKKNNASKFAFISYVNELQKDGVQLIDCQVYTPHLESLGAEFIKREKFESLLKKLIP